MSVIMGYKAKDKIYLAADNKLSTPEGEIICDNEKKIIVVNNNLAVAFAGYYKNQILFEQGIKLAQSDKELTVEDVLAHLRIMYLSFELNRNKEYAKEALGVDSSFIVVGKSKNNECCMYAMSYLNGKLEKPTLTDAVLFPPSDLDMTTCAYIYAKNIKYHYDDFIQRTVKEISKESNVVSPSGDIWIYDFATDMFVVK